MRQIKHKSFMSYLYVALMCLPFIAILSRIIYVQCNKNAFQSYSSVGSATYTEVLGNTTLIENGSYRSYMPKDKVSTLSSYYQIAFNKINVDIEELGYQNVNAIMYHANGYVNLYNGNTQVVSLSLNDVNAQPFLDTNLYFEMNTTFTNIRTNYGYLYQYSLNFNDLDNVFDYSVNKFIENNNFGNMDLTGFIANLFLPSNQVNNLYIHFLNWYLNYALFTSVVYLMFAVLMWFVNYSRRLLDRGMNYDF